MGIVNNQSGINHIDDPFNDYDGNITIERRGNSSQWNDKTPYRFETVDDNYQPITVTVNSESNMSCLCTITAWF